MESIFEKETNLEVEQLLKLKRLEKPDDTYWEKFQRELYDKTLQTLVIRKPWYRRVFESASGQMHPLFPLSAIAMLLCCIIIFNPMTVQVVGDFMQGKEVIAHLEDTRLSKTITAVSSKEQISTTDVIEWIEPSFVVATFTAEPESQTDFTKIAVSKSMPTIHSTNIHYIAGHFRGSLSSVAVANVIQYQ